ncbi:type III pantothenate kinase [Runella slithyformis]|uniref:Type III pantothenate kinase n=1 Tax=Runella slithyformis (strain ATCC 29530 / DSM 19594 / LMG 11500 / NCIMB 11436 / LSU 4) TaxID=761193 RepID=A0A7U3ZNM6_RUNSL|nr:type III pantothenate kinase [Runella slithyformis]AEI50541.1 putative transcriptional acitvator, Baf family [Runella slithyformis DSM 19594]
MNAAIDLGNTFAKIGWFENEHLVEAQYKIPFEALTDVLTSRIPKQAIVSSTSRDTQPYADLLYRLKASVLQLTPVLPVPIGKKYDTPQTLGADRLAAAVGATVLFPNENCLVIDMGTCITYDWVSADAFFHGGIISPGFRMRFQAMHTFTKRLPLIDISEAQHLASLPLIGKSTRTAMESGVINGLLAEVDGFVERYHKEYGKCRVLLCGGDAPFFESRLKNRIFAAPNLVLMGLNRILLYNVNVQNA